MLRPMPIKYGVGFTSTEPMDPKTVEGFRYEQVGQHHNYHVTPDRWDWPIRYDFGSINPTIDAFSPNLNKQLHVGHLRNLTLANSLRRILKNAKFVAMLGCSLGVKKAALDGLLYWLNFTGFQPEVFYDCALPDDLIETREPTVEEVENDVIDVNEGPDLSLPQLWDGPNGPVIVKRSDGRPTYAYHDLALANLVSPDFYITGHEQAEHFANLGLEDKHLPMGLVLGTDGKKMKSREGEVLLATEAMEIVKDNLSETPFPDKLAWNILTWNFLHTTRKSNLKFEAEKWCRPESPGMYISYTYARTAKALLGNRGVAPWKKKDSIIHPTGEGMKTVAVEKDIELRLLGIAETYLYYYRSAIDRMDPAPIANYAHDLARQIGVAYESEPIQKGRPAFICAIAHAMWRLQHCMKDLGMFSLQSV